MESTDKPPFAGVEVADTPSLDKLDGSSLSDNGVPVSNFITDYTDSLGEVHPL